MDELSKNIPEGETAFDRSVIQPSGAGDHVNIDDRGNPVSIAQGQPNIEPEVQTDTADYDSVKTRFHDTVYETAAKDGRDDSEFFYKLREFEESAIQANDADMVELFTEASNTAKKRRITEIRAELKTIPYNDSRRAEADQRYRDAIHRQLGHVPATEASDIVIKSLGWGAVQTLVNFGERVFFNATGQDDKADEVGLKAKFARQDFRNFKDVPAMDLGSIDATSTDFDAVIPDFIHEGSAVLNTPKIDLHSVPIDIDGELVLMMTPFGRSLATAEKTAKATGAAITRFDRILDKVDKVSTAGNMSKLGMTRNVAGGYIYTYGEGESHETAMVAGALGLGAGWALSGTGKTISGATKYLDSAIKTHAGKADKLVISKAEKYLGLGTDDGVTRESLDVVYSNYAKTVNVAAEDLTPSDKLAALKTQFTSIKDATRASESSSPVAQAVSDTKAKQQVSSVLREVFGDVEDLPSTRPRDIKDSVAGTVVVLQDKIKLAINNVKNDINAFNSEFKATVATKELDAPEPTSDYVDTVIDTMRRDGDVDDKLVTKLEQFSIDTPMISTAGDAKALRDLLGTHGHTSTIDDVPLNDRLDNMVLDIVEDAQAGSFLKHQDAVYMAEYFDRLLKTSKLFNTNATPIEKANAVRKFLSTDSYAPLTKVLDGESLKSLENTALASLFLKDGVLTSEGRINFWKLYQDASAIKTVTPEMSATKQLMKAYSDAIGTAKTKPASGLGYERGDKGRSDIKSEILSRGIGSLIANVTQHLPTDAGRTTFLVNHAYKLVKGERVLRADNLNTASLARQLDRSLDDVNDALKRAGYSSAFVYKDIAANSSKPSDQTHFTFFTQPGTIKDGQLTFDGKTFDIVKSDLKFKEHGATLGESFGATRLADHAHWGQLAKTPIVWMEKGDGYYNKGTKVLHLPKDNKSNIPAHEVEHAIHDIEQRVGYGSSPLKEIGPMKQLFPHLDDELLGDPNMSFELYGAYLQSQGVQVLSREVIADMLKRSPWITYQKNAGERLARGTSIVKSTDADYAKALQDDLLDTMQREEEIIQQVFKDVQEGRDFVGGIEASYKQKTMVEQPGDMRIARDDDMNSNQYDPIYQALNKLISDGKDNLMTTTAVKKYLRGAGITNGHMTDLGIDKMVGQKVKPSKLLDKLQLEHNTDFSNTSTYRGFGNNYVDQFFEATEDMATTNRADKNIWPTAIKDADINSYRAEVVRGDTLPPGTSSAHFPADEDYKSHVLLVDGTTQSGKDTTHILEVQTDLEDPVGVADKDWDAYVKARDRYNAELETLHELYPTPSLDDHAYYDKWVAGRAEISLRLKEFGNDVMKLDVPDVMSLYVDADEVIPNTIVKQGDLPVSIIKDKDAFIRDGLNTAIEKAKTSGSTTVSWPQGKVVAGRWFNKSTDNNNANNAKLYERIYDKQMVKMARKYAQAHDLKMPYKEGDIWHLDIESTVERKLTPEQKELKNKERLAKAFGGTGDVAHSMKRDGYGIVAGLSSHRTSIHGTIRRSKTAGQKPYEGYRKPQEPYFNRKRIDGNYTVVLNLGDMNSKQATHSNSTLDFVYEAIKDAKVNGGVVKWKVADTAFTERMERASSEITSITKEGDTMVARFD